MRFLTWPGMPAREALDLAASRVGEPVENVVVSSNERLELEMRALEPFDLVFPSDYLVERLRNADRLLALGSLPIGRLEPWAVAASYDPGCQYSVPYAYGTTGILNRGSSENGTSWWSLLNPAAGTSVGMLDEVREVIGVALMATGHSPNDTEEAALHAAEEVLLAQRPRVTAYDSDDFVGSVVQGRVTAHQAWSGPASQATRRGGAIHYDVPHEGAVLWTTAAAIPSNAPAPERSLAVLHLLMDPQLAALTTLRNGYATPNREACALLPVSLQEDPVLFPGQAVRARCHALVDLGQAEGRFTSLWGRLRGEHGCAPGPSA